MRCNNNSVANLVEQTIVRQLLPGTRFYRDFITHLISCLTAYEKLTFCSSKNVNEYLSWVAVKNDGNRKSKQTVM